MRSTVAILAAFLALPSTTWTASAADGPPQARPQAETPGHTHTQNYSRRLIVVEGDVQVTRADGSFGKGFVGQILHAGDRVMTGPIGHAKISYDDQCIERVRLDRIIVVQRHAPCGLEGWETVSLGEVGGIGSIGSIIGSSPLAIGIGVAAVTGIVAGVATTGLRPGRPTSP